MLSLSKHRGSGKGVVEQGGACFDKLSMSGPYLFLSAHAELVEASC